MLEARDLFLGNRLAGVSAALRPGEITAICGPNGAGKSSLLQALAGLLATESGAVWLEGTSLASLPARDRARAIGYLPQAGEVAWDLSVRNLVALGRLPHGDGGEAQVDAALAALDLAHQLALLTHLRSAAEGGAGVVLVVHDLALAMNHASRVLVLDRGRIAADGAPGEALAPAVIERVWGVPARWLGEPGARALATPRA